MAFDAAQILRQTYAAGAERIDVSSLMRQAEPQAVARGELMGTAVVVESDPVAELMDSMEELSFQFEEKTAKRVGERRRPLARRPCVFRPRGYGSCHLIDHLLR